MAIPGAPTHTIGDLVPEVVDALRGRSDISTIAPNYIKRALQTITKQFAFEHLRRTGPSIVLTAGTAIYPVSQFLSPGDDYTSPESFAIYVDPPTNSVVGSVDYKTPKAMELMSAPSTKGTPSRFTRYGTNFTFGPTPDKGYTVFLRYQVRHPFSSNLTNDPVYVGEDWEDIIIYSAAERLALVKGWNDQYNQLHSVLYGDGTRPGLMTMKTEQYQHDQMFNTRQLGIRVPRYGGR